MPKEQDMVSPRFLIAKCMVDISELWIKSSQGDQYAEGYVDALLEILELLDVHCFDNEDLGIDND